MEKQDMVSIDELSEAQLKGLLAEKRKQKRRNKLINDLDVEMVALHVSEQTGKNISPERIKRDVRKGLLTPKNPYGAGKKVALLFTLTEVNLYIDFVKKTPDEIQRLAKEHSDSENWRGKYADEVKEKLKMKKNLEAANKELLQLRAELSKLKNEKK